MSTVVIVGGGPAGLSAAAALRRIGVADVIVVEREQHAGGIPRHTDHLGFGIRDVHRLLRGPVYAARLARSAVESGAVVRTNATVLDVRGTGITLADGSTIEADAVVLATGVRERPRAARLVPGDRPSGIFTTGAVQQLIALHRAHIGRRAVIVGAEHVSFSAIWTLRHGGCEPVAMITALPRHQTSRALRVATAGLHRVPVFTGVHITAIVGRHRVQAVELSDGRRLECDTVVFTGDWVPDHELSRRAGLLMLPVARSPVIDSSFHTSVPGVFAIGNLVHPAETADMCALDGRVAASSVERFFFDGEWPSVGRIIVAAPIMWAAPTAHGLTLRVSEATSGRIIVRVDGTIVTTTRSRTMTPNRAVHVDAPTLGSAGSDPARTIAIEVSR